MASDIDHIIGATQDKEITIFVFDAPIEGGVNRFTRHCVPISFDKTLVITPNGLQATRWQRTFNGHHAFLVGLRQFFTRLIVQQLHVVAENSFARRAKFAGCFFNAVAHRQDRPTRFCLPIVVNNGFAETLGNPLSSGLVQRLAR